MRDRTWAGIRLAWAWLEGDADVEGYEGGRMVLRYSGAGGGVPW